MKLYSLIITENLNKVFNLTKKTKNENCLMLHYENKDGEIIKKCFKASNRVRLDSIQKIKYAKFGSKSNKTDVKKKVENYLINFDKYNSLNRLTQYFNDFLFLYINFICPRCCRSTEEGKEWSKKHSYGVSVGNGTGHNSGYFNILLRSAKEISDKQIKNYLNDTEHGLFHGLMTSFLCYLINSDKNLIEKKDAKKKFEQMFASATLHDFLKCNKFKQEEHDKQLKNYFIHLLDETYVHSDPPEELKDKHLIMADRLELRRYNNYNLWVDDRFKRLYEIMTPETKDMIDVFYNNMRPALKYLLEKKDDSFIRHGLEENNELMYKKHKNFPPKNSGWNIYQKTDINGNKVKLSNDGWAYPIEIDSMPLDACSNHCGTALYNTLKGYITKEQFNKNGGKVIVRSKIKEFIPRTNLNKECERDHLFAQSESIPLKEWLFLYKKYKKDDARPYWKIKRDISYLIDNDIRIVNQDVVFNFFKLIKLLKTKFIMLN